MQRLQDRHLAKDVKVGAAYYYIADNRAGVATSGGLVGGDANIHSVEDVDALPFAPKMVNVKPSRFGPLRRLFHMYDTCAERGIGMYGGGQFELGPGRGQIQYLASIFHPDGPNDVAPTSPISSTW